MTTKYIFVTSGVVSSQDKGIMISMLARILKFRGFSVTVGKFDSCLNIDCGALNIDENGECFVTAEGDEVNHVLGCYERFADIETTCDNYVTLGHIYRNVMDRECRGDYAGETVRLNPHITDEIIRKMTVLGSKVKCDFVIIEIGGDVSSADTLPYVEAICRFKSEQKHDCVCLHLQNATEDTLTAVEDIADIVTNLHSDCSVREIRKQKLDEEVLSKLGVVCGDRYDSTEWDMIEDRRRAATEVVEIALVGQRVGILNAYDYITSSIAIASAYNDVKPVIRCISSDRLNTGNVGELLVGVDGVIVASDFNTRSIEGKVVALQWCRKHDIPTLGIGQGMQGMVIEYARNVGGLNEAGTTEADRNTPHNVIDVMAERKMSSIVGGIKRLGAYRCDLAEGSIAKKAYGRKTVQERHRHVYELNNDYQERLESSGMRFTGINPETGLVEVVEVPGNTWYVGTQFQPEYNCSVLRPNPLLTDFVRATKEKKNK